MDVSGLAPGLWRWTASHPGWTPADADEWGPDVGCVYYEAGGRIVLVDPQVPGANPAAERFWRALDRDVERLGPPAIILTIYYHARGAADIAARYDGTRVWAEARKSDLAAERAPVTDVFRVGDDVAGARTVDALTEGEVVLWLPVHASLVTGDVLLGDDAGGVRVCPDDWIEDGTSPVALRDALRPLLDLPVARILVSHGEPVLAGAREALARALHE